MGFSKLCPVGFILGCIFSSRTNSITRSHCQQRCYSKEFLDLKYNMFYPVYNHAFLIKCDSHAVRSKLALSKLGYSQNLWVVNKLGLHKMHQWNTMPFLKNQCFSQVLLFNDFKQTNKKTHFLLVCFGFHDSLFFPKKSKCSWVRKLTNELS